MSHNINSIPKNFDTFCNHYIDNRKLTFDIFGFCETKLSSDIEHLYKIPGYIMYTNNNKRNKGGLAIYIRDNYQNVLIRKDLFRSLQDIEAIFLEVIVNNKHIIVGMIYRRPTANINVFTNELESIIEVINNENKKLYLCGDLNLNLLAHNSNNHVQSLVDIFHSNNIFNFINKPTRVTSSTATLIDLIWSNDLINNKLNGIFYDQISDHFPVFSFFDIKSNSFDHNYRTSFKFRDFSTENMNNFKYALQEVDWNLTYASDNPNIAYNNFLLIFKSLFDAHFPVIVKNISEKSMNKPYITNELKQ